MAPNSVLDRLYPQFDDIWVDRSISKVEDRCLILDLHNSKIVASNLVGTKRNQSGTYEGKSDLDLSLIASIRILRWPHLWRAAAASVNTVVTGFA